MARARTASEDRKRSAWRGSIAPLLYVAASLLVACGGGGGDGSAGDDGVPNVPKVFETTFDDANFPTIRAPGIHWDQLVDPATDAAIGQVGDGIREHGHWTSNGIGDQILVAANFPGGGGGKGFRHWRGIGSNVTGGGLTITLPAPVTEMWVRLYMRFSDGFAWTTPDPNYTKDMYWNVGGAFLIFGHQGGGWGLHSSDGSQNIPSSSGWANTPPGQWHLFEYHVKQDGGVVEVWVNGQQVLSRSGVSLGNATWDFFALGENQCCVATGGYTDYDDIAISIVGRIGPH